MKNEELGVAWLIFYPSVFRVQRCPRRVVSELKKPGVFARMAFAENLTHCKERIDTTPQPSP